MIIALLILAMLGLWWMRRRQARGLSSTPWGEPHPFGNEARMIGGRWVYKTEDGWEQAAENRENPPPSTDGGTDRR